MTGIELSEDTRHRARDLRQALSTKKHETPPAMEDGLIDTKAVARLLHVSRRTLARFVSEGALPDPIRIGGTIVRWRAEEVREWIECDCPGREEWSQIRQRKLEGLSLQPRGKSRR